MLAVILTGCVKDDPIYVADNLYLGKWELTTNNNTVLDFTYRADNNPDPYYITIANDSLHIVRLPVVNEHFKIISVDKKILNLTKNNIPVVYKRVDPN